MSGSGVKQLTSEELREALVDLDRLRRKEMRQRQENEVLLCGLHAVVKPRPPRQLFYELVRVFKEVIGFRDAAVFVAREQRLRLWAATRPHHFGGRWRLSPTFERALQGHVIASFDLARLKAAPAGVCGEGTPLCSALVFSIRTARMKALVLCTHPQKGFFNSDHRRLVRRFTPLATQGLLNVESFSEQTTRERLDRERREAAEQLSFLERAVEDLGVGVCTLNGGRLDWVSETLVSLLRGFRSAEVWWRRVLERVSLEELLQKLHGEKGSHETYVTDDGGLERAFRISGSALTQAYKRQPLLVIQEFTAVMNAERALVRSRQQKAAILDAASDGVVTLDAAGTVLGMNRAATRIFGYQQEQAVGLAIQDLVTWAGSEPGYEVLERWAVAQEPVELMALQVDGTVISVEMSLTRLSAGAGLIYAAFFRDITERKESERLLRAAKADAEEASAAKTQFLATISHELRTPLNVVQGMIELVSDDITDQQQLKWLEAAGHSAQMLGNLIEGLLAVTRMDSGGLEITVSPVPLLDLLQQLCRSMEPRAASKGLSLTLSICPRAYEVVRLDGKRLEQILTNLIDNGIKFSDRGAVIVRVTVLAEESDRQVLRFSVTDTGIGIPESRRELVFEPFFQVDGSSRRRHGGVGLGLAISTTLAELMGGKLQFTSREGEGSCFFFDLPVQEDTSKVIEMAPDWDPMQVDPKHILLVEDHPGNRTLAERFLASAGHVVTTACDGPDGVEAFTSCRFDLVFLDIEMPHMDGLEAARKMRAHELLYGLERTPIVALTAHALESFRESSLEAGMDGFMVKPIERLALLRSVVSFTHGGNPAGSEAESGADTGSETDGVITIDEGIADLIPLFFERRQEEIEELRQALADNRLDVVQRIGHGLKGCGASYGFPKVSEMGAALESAGRNASCKEAESRLRGLENYLMGVNVRVGEGRLVAGAALLRGLGGEELKASA